MATPTISEYTSHLRVDKTNMRNYLATIGIDTKESDTFTELTKAVDRIRTQAPQLYTQEEEPAVKQGIWLKGSNIVINQVLNDSDLYFKEELSYCGDNPLTEAHKATYYYYLYSEGQTYLITPTKSGDSNDFTLYKVNPITLSLEFVVRAKTGVNCSISKTFIRKNILHIGHVAQADLTYLRYDMTTGEKLSNFLFDAKYNNTSTSTRAWSSNVIYNEKYDALFVGEAKTNNYNMTYLHRYDFETGEYTAIKHKYGTRSSGFKLHAHPECILVNGSYYAKEKQYTNVYKIGLKTMVGITGYGDYGYGGFTNSAVLGSKTYLDIGDKYYSFFDYDAGTDKITIKKEVYWNEDQSALNPTIATVIPLNDRLIFLNPAKNNYTYYSFGGIDKVYPDKTLVLFQGNQINSAKFSTQLMPSALLSGKALVTPYNAIYYYTDEYGYNSPYPIYYGNGKRWVPVAPSSSEDTDDFEPLLQDKSVEITENGTTNVTADEGYDGLNSVEVNVNVGSSGEVPQIGFTVDALDDSGYATKITTYGFSALPNSFLRNATTTASQQNVFTGHLKEVVLNEGLVDIAGYAFYNNIALEKVKFPSTLTTIRTYAFFNCIKFKINRLPDSVTTIGAPFGGTKITQLSSKNLEKTTAGSAAEKTFPTTLVAVWFGSKVTSLSYYTFNSGSVKYIFIDLPRATVETISNYSVRWGASSDAVIICNDDEGFISQEEFDAIDWSTYTGE